ncbi:MAG: deoxyribonuclease IV [Sphaerochaetaceae bacterium]|jgi:deoxyribonuclease-4
MHYIGAHVSAAGGPYNAVENAIAIGANAFALFTKNQKQWSAPALTEEQIELFKTKMAEGNFSAKQVLPHDSYLINLGNPELEKWEKSVLAFTDELLRVAQLGLDRLNFHPGAHLNQIEPVECMKLIAKGIDTALEKVEGVYAVIETTAGQGSALGKTFEEIAQIIEFSKYQERIGVCIDTCHIFAAGYDIRTEKTFTNVTQQFQSVIGFDKLMGVHLNDAKSGYDSKVDRHSPLGEGNLGLEPFRLLMQDERFKNIPLILETNDPSRWADEINLLRSFAL